MAMNKSQIYSTKDSSNLLAHEAAFVLGQIQDVGSVPALKEVLEDFSLHYILRHKAAEALGAIGVEDNIRLLEMSLRSDPAPKVRETCELALSRIEEQKHTKLNGKTSDVPASPFMSVDPVALASFSSTIYLLSKVLFNEKKSMYEQYAALLITVPFILLGNWKSIHIENTSSPKNAFPVSNLNCICIGQLQNKAACDALAETLKDVTEHPMVRHEAVGDFLKTKTINLVVVELLENFVKDPEPIVSQSCEVTFSMLEFEKSVKYLFRKVPQVDIF
ncbi:hypothetical protein MKW98_000820 [Papaver atlanticum]|uniref:Uncharacterized protein n=1 Tax=Papaver atlanticum TaxID=357466 RepID=A0AAD4SCJ9_9MAGN|nr:hypothetical protein MKW98_000820 [Papaver atlanticum]